MKASELVARIQAAIAEHGDLKIFHGDMKPAGKDYFEVVMTSTEDPDERELYGDKYIHIGDY